MSNGYRELIDETLQIVSELRLEINATRQRVIELELRVNAIQDRQDHPYKVKPAEDWNPGGTD